MHAKHRGMAHVYEYSGPVKVERAASLRGTFKTHNYDMTSLSSQGLCPEAKCHRILRSQAIGANAERNHINVTRRRQNIEPQH
jgi:hypothetical protein